jgi:hypothetical protein
VLEKKLFAVHFNVSPHDQLRPFERQTTWRASQSATIAVAARQVNRMPTAQLNVRVPAEHHDLVRMIAARLRQDKGFAESLAAFVADQAGTVADRSNSRSNVDPILDELAITQAQVRAIHMTLHDVVTLRDRLEILEAEVAGLRQRGADEPVEPVEGVEARIDEALEPEALLDELLDEIAPEPRQRAASTALDAVEPVEVADMPVSTKALSAAAKRCQTRR